MIAVRVVVGVLAVVGIAAVLASMLRTVVLPRGVPARLARIAFLAVYWLLISTAADGSVRLRHQGPDICDRGTVWAVRSARDLGRVDLASVRRAVLVSNGRGSRRPDYLARAGAIRLLDANARL